MKKVWYIAFAIVLSTSILGYKFAFSNAYINKANENIDINGLKLLMKESFIKEMPDKKFKLTGGFGCNVYKSENDGIEITFSGFPDVSNNYVLTYIITTNSVYHFYNIRVGDPIEKAEDILIKNGFNKSSKNSSKRYMSFNKRRLNASLTLNDESKISEIRIGLEQTNIFHIIF